MINDGLTLQANSVVTGDRLTLGGTSQAVTGSGELSSKRLDCTSVATLENGVALRGVSGKSFLLNITDHSSLRNRSTISAAGVTACNIAGRWGLSRNEGTMSGPSSVTLIMTIAHWANSGPFATGPASIGGQSRDKHKHITCTGV